MGPCHSDDVMMKSPEGTSDQARGVPAAKVRTVPACCTVLYVVHCTAEATPRRQLCNLTHIGAQRNRPSPCTDGEKRVGIEEGGRVGLCLGGCTPSFHDNVG